MTVYVITFSIEFGERSLQKSEDKRCSTFTLFNSEAYLPCKWSLDYVKFFI